MAAEKFIGMIMPTIFAAWQWLVECCVDTFNRYNAGKDGVIPYKGMTGR